MPLKLPRGEFSPLEVGELTPLWKFNPLVPVRVTVPLPLPRAGELTPLLKFPPGDTLPPAEESPPLKLPLGEDPTLVLEARLVLSTFSVEELLLNFREGDSLPLDCLEPTLNEGERALGLGDRG